ncbi:hypothetical protein [Labrys wisconsinensis]|uniref:Uncharacterized protein n=1 Tax=Labrys wisconsinensis TaxID=425677 RepID=A0ABU0JBX6_9HYPH|nr:hypothetical protein [Labrys wisconsinensis]MDQ0471790.1 hypothetical protein [Labrys wisconsinensis]
MSDVQDDIYEDEFVRECFAVIEGWERRFGIELKSLFDPDQHSYAESTRLLRERIIDGIDRYDGFPPTEAEGSSSEPFSTRFRRGDAPVEFEPNFFITRENAEIISKYQGDSVLQYVGSLRKSLDLMASSDTVESLVASSLSTGVLIVGSAILIEVRIAMAAGTAFRAALLASLKSTGLKSAIATIVVLAAAILLWAIVGRKSKILGLVINDTDANFVVTNWRDGTQGYKSGNLYMTHGALKSFPVSHIGESLNSPEVQLNGRSYLEDGSILVAASMFYAEAKAGFRGAEGIFLFTDYDKQATGYAYQFAVPYTNANGVYLQPYWGGEMTKRDEINSLFRTMYDKRQTYLDGAYQNMIYRASINSSKGQECCAIAYFSIAPKS